RFVGERELLLQLTKGLALITLTQKQLEQRGVSDRPYRVVLAGLPNVGKSSLVNALARTEVALVSDEPGTARDYPIGRMELDEMPVEFIDTAGWQPAQDTTQEQAQRSGRALLEEADLVLWCQEAGFECDRSTASPVFELNPAAVMAVATKCDLRPAS